jgi:hypothetical protein
MACMLTFYIKQWEEFHTDILDLGVFNVTEAQIVTIAIFLSTGYYGMRSFFLSFLFLGFLSLDMHIFFKPILD